MLITVISIDFKLFRFLKDFSVTFPAFGYICSTVYF